MRSSNPVFNSLTDTRGTQYRESPGAPFNPYVSQAAVRAMTIDDVITKTALTLGVIIAFAVANFSLAFVSLNATKMLTFVGMIGGLVTVLIWIFARKNDSAVVTLTYAAFEGLAVGGFSCLMIGTRYGYQGFAMILQAVLGTIGVFIGMLIVYKSGAIRVTPKFNRIITGMIIGVLVLAIGNTLLYLFTGMFPLSDGGPMAIIFSLFCIGLAAMSFLSDFDAADRMIRQRAPAKLAWGVALGLAVTLVWLYTEILRLLSYFRN